MFYLNILGVETELIINIIGFLMSIVSIIMFLPQAVAIWKHRGNPNELKGVSIAGQGMVLVNATGWGLYAILTKALWVGAPGLVNAPVAIFAIFILLRARNSINSSRIEKKFNSGICGCGWREEDGGHALYVTAPPGYGSVMTCPGFKVDYGKIIPFIKNRELVS